MQIERQKPLTARVGLFCVGHHTYWAQYPGLYEELMGYHAVIRRRIEGHGVQVTDFGMANDAESAYQPVGEKRLWLTNSRFGKLRRLTLAADSAGLRQASIETVP